jgi:predicted phosphodiesterase
MSMRVAVLSDVHGNLPALEAVLAEIEHTSVDRIVLTGDIAAGPLPGETLDRLVGLGERVVWVRGNCERLMVAAFDGEDAPGEATTTLVEAARQISRAQRDLLANLPLTVTLDIEGLGPALFCHATPRRDDEVVLVDSPPSRFGAVLEGVSEAVVVLGHTHMPFARLHGRRWVVNPGSVGMPYGHGGAGWVLLGPAIELKRTPYDPEVAAKRLRQSAMPNAPAWVEEFVLKQYSDLEALEAFTPMARDAAL